MDKIAVQEIRNKYDKENAHIDKWKIGFNHITPLECKKVYPIVIENAHRHKRIAAILAENGEYGSAIAHLVLSSEELLKGAILLGEGVGIKLRSKIKGINRFFNDHKIRHEFAAFINALGFITSMMFEWLNAVKDKNEGVLKELTIEYRLIKNGDEKKSSYIQKLLFVFEGSEWWMKADYFKQRGFYVGFNNQVLTPDVYTETDYMLAFQIVESLFKNIETIIAEVEKGSYTVNKEVLRYLEKNGFYSMFQDMVDLSINFR